jgi:DNA-directed RNA polymerase subunit RPC12/RpoP
LTQPPDPLRTDLEQAHSLYVQLAARVAPGKGQAGRRIPPGSRPPLDMAMVSAMADLEQYLAWWCSQARYLLYPVTKIELTARTGVRCPHCGADLIAWVRPEDPAKSEIVCTNPSVDHDGTRRWPEPEWKRLGVLAGVHEDGRFGARLHAVGEG